MDQRTQNKISSPTDGTSKAQVLSEDEIFHLLNTARRREVVKHLLKTDEAIQLPELARHVAAIENELSFDEVTPKQYQRIYVPLYQSQLPKLDRAGVIRYDQSEGTVEPTNDLSVFLPYLEESLTEEVDTESNSATRNFDKQEVSSWYFISAFFSAILLLAVTLELTPISGEFLSGVIIVLFLAANAAARR